MALVRANIVAVVYVAEKDRHHGPAVTERLEETENIPALIMVIFLGNRTN